MICCICNKEFDEIEKIDIDGHEFYYRGGHNPHPIEEEGRCCTNCNFTIVVPERMKLSINNKNKD